VVHYTQLPLTLDSIVLLPLHVIPPRYYSLQYWYVTWMAGHTVVGRYAPLHVYEAKIM
jgi:hypothetical protein